MSVGLAGEFVAQFKFTVLLMPNGPMRITGGFFDAEPYETANSIQNEDLKVCFMSLYSVFTRATICFSQLHYCTEKFLTVHLLQ